MSKKRKKTSEHDAGGAVSAPVEGDVTSPDLAGTAGDVEEPPFGGPEPDTQVGPPPGEPASDHAGDHAHLGDESWDGPTNVGTEDEMAELAAASMSHGDGAPEGAAEALAEPGEPAPEAPPRSPPGGWGTSSRACCSPAIAR